MMRLALIGIFAWLISSFALQQTDGFTLAKIATAKIESSAVSFDETLLQRPFTYLCKGGQSYVFLSEDKDYVLKCFRSSKQQNLTLLTSFFPLKSLKRKKLREEIRLKETLKSYALSYEILPKETALLCVHLNDKTKINTPLKLVDKVGICHTIDPNNISFVIQKKANLVKDHITLMMQTEGNAAAKNALKELILLVQERLHKGIDDKDPNLAKNFGFVDGHPVQIDGGSFFENPRPSLDKVISSKEDIQHWINASFPELSADFDHLFQEYLYECI